MEPKANMVKAGTRGKGGEKGQKGSSGALKGKVICITGLNSDRKGLLARKIEENGGHYTDTFRGTCEVLIASSATTKKYQAAVHYHIPVVSPSWVDESIKRGEPAPLSDFKIDPLMKVIVCATGFSAEEREIIAQRVQSLGGEYDPELLEKVTHFLIAKRPEGEKYGAAKDWGIPIVSLAWLKACETRGCCVAAEDHPVTRERDRPPTLKAAPQRVLPQRGAVSDLVLRTAFLPETDQRIEAEWESVPESRALEDCRVFIGGLDMCPPARKLALLGLLHKASGTAAFRVQNAVTHVVVAQPDFLTDRAVDMLTKFPTNPAVVSPAWLYDSASKSQMAPVTDYPVLSTQLPVKLEDKQHPPSPAPPIKPAAPRMMRRSQSIPLPPRSSGVSQQSREFESLAENLSPRLVKQEQHQDRENMRPIPPSPKSQQALQDGQSPDEDFLFPKPAQRLKGNFGRPQAPTAIGSKRPFPSTSHGVPGLSSQDDRDVRRRSTLELHCPLRGRVVETQMCNPESQIIGYGEDDDENGHP